MTKRVRNRASEALAVRQNISRALRAQRNGEVFRDVNDKHIAAHRASKFVVRAMQIHSEDPILCQRNERGWCSICQQHIPLPPASPPPAPKPRSHGKKLHP